ncbi:MAG: helix-turn-helix domain-containing protein [Ktedonobacterales bacterium]
MAAKTPRGRPLATPTTAIGQLVVEHLRTAKLTETELAARLHVSRATLWRLLRGQTTYTNSLRVLDLCAALELDGESEAAFLRVWLDVAGPRARPTRRSAQARALAEQVLTTREPARDVAEHTSGVAERFSAFVAEKAGAAGLSYTKLARTLGVEASTLTRLVHGTTRATHQVRAEALAEALALDAVSRRTFLRLAVEAGVFAVTTGVGGAPYQTRFSALERSVGKSLDALEVEFGELQPLCDTGGALAVLPRAEWIFARLYDDGGDPTRVTKAPELARAKLRAGFLLLVAQAAALGWFDRAQAMLLTCDRMQNEVFGYLGAIPAGYETEYGHLLNQSAPLYRMIGDVRHTMEAYDVSIRRFTYAITALEKRVRDDSLRVSFYRNRAHVYAVLGRTKEWQADLVAAERIARTIGGPVGGAQEAMVTYSWGEGYKRLAYLDGTPPEKRRVLAGRALEALRQARVAIPFEWSGYGLLLRVAEAQCLVWSEPEEALRQAATLHEEALRVYPSLAQKVERLRESAERQRRPRQPRA